MSENYHPFSRKFWFGQVDTRALSFYRIIFALLALKDAMTTFPMLDLLYRDSGVLPRETAMQITPDKFSVLFGIPADWMVTAFFVLWLLVGVKLLIGWHTRIMLILHLVIFISVVNRNLYATNASDAVFIFVNLWLCFLPTANYYSIDALRKRWQQFQHSSESVYLSPTDAAKLTFALPLRLLQMQFVLVYFWTGLSKITATRPAWLDGSAIYHVLQLRTYTHGGGDFVLEVAPYWFLQMLTWGTIVIEVAFIFLVFAPLLQPLARVIGLVSGAMLHTAIILTMSIRNFSLVMMGSYIFLMPSSWLQWFDDRLRHPAKSLQLTLDDVSPLWVIPLFIPEENLRVESSHWLSESSNVPSLKSGRVREGSTFDTWLIEEDETQLTGIDAWLAIAAHMPFNRLWRFWLRVRPVRWSIWQVARLIVAFGIPTNPNVYAPRLSQPKHNNPLRPLYAGLVIALFCLIVSSNVWLVPNREGETLPKIWQTTLTPFSLFIDWEMFSPPIPFLLYPKFIADFEDAPTLELLTQKRPFESGFTRWRWGGELRLRNFIIDGYLYNRETIYGNWARYYCRQYKSNPDLPNINTIEVFIYRDWTQAPDEESRAPDRELMIRVQCP